MRQKPEANWGSATEAQVYSFTLSNSYRLQHVQEHIKNYRPQFLVLSGDPETREGIVRLVHEISGNVSLMICAEVGSGFGNGVLLVCECAYAQHVEGGKDTLPYTHFLAHTFTRTC